MKYTTPPIKLLSSCFVRIITIVTLVLLTHIAPCALQAQTKDSSSHKLNIVPLPLIGATPTFGFLVGVAPGFNWFMGDSRHTTMSSAWVTASYTTKKQLLINARGSAFSEGDKWNLHFDLRVMLNSQPTYGLAAGAHPDRRPVVSERLSSSNYPSMEFASTPQTLKFDHYRVYQTLLRRFQSTRLFYGIGYHLDIMNRIRDEALRTDTSNGQPFVLTHHYAYSDLKGFNHTKYTQSGVSLNIAFDSRNNTINTTSGRYAQANFKMFPTFLGSSKGSTQLWLEYRDYLRLSEMRPRHLIAFWTYGHFVTSGQVPYLFLPTVGVDMFGRSGRPYTQGRFRGDELVYGEVEYRFPLLRKSDLLGGVLFVNSVSASSKDASIGLFNDMGVGYGLGLRVMLSKKSKANLALDYGFGVNGTRGIFFGLNETF